MCYNCNANKFLHWGDVMESFVSNIATFVKECNAANGIMTRKMISSWFRDKKAIKRDGDVQQVDFDNKTAIVIIGVSCIGKTTYIHNFLVNHSDFVYISSDDVSYQKEDEKKSGVNPSETRVTEILEQQMLEAQNENLIIDIMCIHPASRAALMRFLSSLGYEIHAVYFSKKYTEENIKKRIEARAIELVLYQDYLINHQTRKRVYMKDIMKVRNDILGIYARKKRISVEELKVQTAKLTETTRTVISLTRFYNDEVERNRVWWQEIRGLFALGADYYYEL